MKEKMIFKRPIILTMIIMTVLLFLMLGITGSADTVYVDDDYYNGGTNDGHIYGIDAFSKIQDAVDASAVLALNLPVDPVTMTIVWGIDSQFITTLSNVPPGYDVTNRPYVGWCVDEYTPINTSGRLYSVTLWSSYDPLMPWPDPDWDMVNYVINHKHTDAAKQDIQDAIWYFINGGNDPATDIGMSMVENATDFGEGYEPSAGEVCAVLCEIVDQKTFIEVRVPPLDCGTVIVYNGTYAEQIIINKNISLIGVNNPHIVAPTLNPYTITESSSTWYPIIFAYGGTMTGNAVSGAGTISVSIDGFTIDGRNKANTVDIMYRNVRPGCISNAIVNNNIRNSEIGIGIWSSSDILIGRNLIRYHPHAINLAGDSYDIMIKYNWILENDVGILVAESGGFEPDDIEAYYNYIYSNCAMDIGIDNQVSNMVEATDNWFGVDGPCGGIADAITGRIADGSGEQVIGSIHFDPWAGVEASGSVTPTDALTGDIIHYDASDSFAYGGTIGPADWNPDNYNYVLDRTPLDIQYFWDFDDGIYSFQQSGAHIYDSPGTYTVVLRVRALDGYLQQTDGYYGGDGFLFDFKQFTVTVSSPVIPLMANADAGNFGGYEGEVGENTQFYGSATGGMPPYTYSWSFDDGSTSDLQNPIHTYETDGIYTVILTVTDEEGSTASDTAQTIVHEADDLIANAGGPYIGVINRATYFHGSANGGIKPYTYIWDFGDDTLPIQAQNPVHSFSVADTYYATFLVIDKNGNTDKQTFEIIISEDGGNNVKILDIQGGFGIKTTILAGNEPINWTINLDGGFIFLDGSSSGTIDPNGIQTVKTSLFSLGFGKVDITVTANSVVEKRTGFMLGPFILSVK